MFFHDPYGPIRVLALEETAEVVGVDLDTDNAEVVGADPDTDNADVVFDADADAVDAEVAVAAENHDPVAVAEDAEGVAVAGYVGYAGYAGKAEYAGYAGNAVEVDNQPKEAIARAEKATAGESTDRKREAMIASADDSDGELAVRARVKVACMEAQTVTSRVVSAERVMAVAGVPERSRVVRSDH